MQQPDRVTTSVRAYSSGEPGRVVCNARDRYFLVGEPVAFGGAGEEIDPGEAFLSGVAACAVGMLEGLSRQANLPLQRVEVWAEVTVDLAAPPSA